MSQKWGQRIAKVAQAPCWRDFPPGRTGAPPGVVPPPLVPYLAPYFYPSRGNPRTEVFSPIYIAEPPPPSVLPRES